MYISKYNSLEQTPRDIQIALDPEVTVGSFVAVLDSPADTRYHISKVMDITDQNIIVHYYGTSQR